MNTGLFIARSNRVEELAELLVQRLEADAPADPVEPQEVIVGSRGMERWLRHRIATRSRQQICANVSFLFPEAALSARVGALLGEEPPAEDPWAPDRLAFSVLRILQERADDPTFREVQRWLAADVPGPHDASSGVGGRAWTLARELADVIDRLTRYRPDLLLPAVPPKELAVVPWLPLLWRTLVERIERPHFAARLAALVACRTAERPTRTLRVFGVSALPPATLRTLHQLGRHGRVELFAFVPSTAWWADFRGRSEARRLARAYRETARDDLLAALRTELQGQNALLTSLGRLSRDFQAVVEAECEGYQELELPAQERPEETVLAALQADLRDARPAPEPKRQLDPADRSVELHACYGALRQVELLRDRLLGLFAADPTLRPRDVLVMTPSLPIYAPLVSAVFGVGRDTPREGEGWGPSGAPRLPVTVSDLGLRALNPVADALLRILAFADGRMNVTGLAELLALQPVRERFGIAAGELETVRGWLATSGVRWAADAAERAVHGQPADEANTLLFGLRRLALGVVQADDPAAWRGGPVPVDDLEGGEVVLLGRLFELVRTLTARTAALRGTRSAAAWAPLLDEVIASLTSTGPETAFLTAQVTEAIRELQSAAREAGCEVPLRLAGIRRWLEGRFDAPIRGDRPIQGAITLSTLSPMRSVPYPVVVLLGMDDGVFPRAPAGLGFDPIRAHPRIGDRDARDEDRHLVLEALLSARRHFLAIYTGHDERTKEARPPTVPLADLLDTLDAGFRVADGSRPSRALTTHHPLQPFSTEMFAPSSPTPTFGRGMHAVAVALARPTRRSPLLFGPDERLTPPARTSEAPAELTLRELVAAVRQPVRALLQRRLRLSLGDWDDRLLDREPVELDTLQDWALTNELLALALRLEGDGPVDPAPLYARLRAEGRLPLGEAGREHFALTWASVAAPLTASHDARRHPLPPLPLELPVGPSRLTGQITGRYDAGNLVRVVSDDPGKPKHLLAAWVELLAAATATPGGPRLEVTIFGDSPKRPVRRLRAPEDPAAALRALVELQAEALCRPLRLTEKTTGAFARALGVEGLTSPTELGAAFEEADGEWSRFDEESGESGKPELAAVFGELGPHRLDPFEARPHPEFVTLAQRLWLPLLAAEVEA